MKQKNSSNHFDIRFICELRQSGVSLQQIADTIGRMKERVRQILVKTNGSSKHDLLSTQQLFKKLLLPRNQILELYKDGIIVPALEWTSGNHHYLLWDNRVADEISSYYKMYRQCKICGQIEGSGRWIYCSVKCDRKGQQYRYKSAEAKQKQLSSIKMYMSRRKQLDCITSVSLQNSPDAVNKIDEKHYATVQ